jgi:hypothetical protein
VTPRKKKKNHPRHALPIFNDPVSSPVLPKYFARQSTNLLGQELKNREIVDRSKWLTLYPDPWDPTRVYIKKASDTNYWYAFLYDRFLNGKLSRWGGGSSNVLSFLVKSDILKLVRVGIDLVPIMTYKFVFACLPCLWKTYLEVLVDAIKRNPHLIPKANHFLYLLFLSRCEDTIFMVKENTFNSETGITLVVDRRTPFDSLHFFLDSKFLLRLCPECLDKQVSKSLLATASRTRHSSEAHALLFQMSDHQEGKLLDNLCALIKPWKDMWGHYVGGKFPYFFISCDTQIYIT